MKQYAVKVHNEEDLEYEINQRIRKDTQMYHILKNSFIGKKEVSICTDWSIWNFANDIWVLTKAQRSKAEGAEMKYFKRVKRITKRDKKERWH